MTPKTWWPSTWNIRGVTCGQTVICCQSYSTFVDPNCWICQIVGRLYFQHICLPWTVIVTKYPKPLKPFFFPRTFFFCQMAPTVRETYFHDRETYFPVRTGCVRAVRNRPGPFYFPRTFCIVRDPSGVQRVETKRFVGVVNASKQWNPKSPETCHIVMVGCDSLGQESFWFWGSLHGAKPFGNMKLINF